MGTAALSGMSDQRSVSDLVFRDLAEPTHPHTPEDEEWQALLRAELGKLRPAQSGPRVVPAASAAEERLQDPAH
jgi:hypothetical protein